MAKSPFTVGHSYRNRKGRYRVIAVDGPKMRVRYENGEMSELTLDRQERIVWTVKKEMDEEKRREEAAAAEEKRRKEAAPAARKADIEDFQFRSV